MLDWQARRTGEGFQTNAIAGKIVHGVLGWDKLVPESTALYLGPTRPMFRKAAKPEPEARLWAACGMAAGIQPWWHHLGASQDDRRQLRTAERLSRWHAENEAYLVDRTPIATVGVAWSEANIDWYGRGESATRAVAPFAGVAEALGLHRIPWRAVHADHVARDAPELDVLVLPNLAAMSDAQCAAVRRFVEGGGGLVATGETSLYDEEGRRRADFALADLLGAHATGEHRGSFDGAGRLAVGELGRSQLPARDRGATRPPALEGFEDDRHPALRRAGRDRAGGAGGRGPAHARAGLAAVAPRERLDARAADGDSRPRPPRHRRPRPGRLPARGPRPLLRPRPHPRPRPADREPRALGLSPAHARWRSRGRACWTSTSTVRPAGSSSTSST